MKNWKDAKNNELVCYCVKVDKQTIVSSIQDGNNSLDKIKEATGACTGNKCKQLNPSGKCCAVDIKALIQIYGENIDDNSKCDCCR